MKPEDHCARLWKATVSRGRMYLKSHLGFLPGIPLRRDNREIVWIPLGGLRRECEICLSAEDLRRATYGWTTLENRFLRSVPRIVQNVERRMCPVPSAPPRRWLAEAHAALGRAGKAKRLAH